jgi:hypothetical protein
VSVGEIYILNCEVVPPKIPHAPDGTGGRIGTGPSVGKARIGNPASSGKNLGITGTFGLHPKTL